MRCPTCAGQVVVPTPEAAGQEEDSADAQPFVFERHDFDEVFSPSLAASPPPAPSRAAGTASLMPGGMVNGPVAGDAPAGAWGTHAEPPFDVERLDPAAASRSRKASGLVLSPTKATVLSVIWIVSVILAFSIGLILGLFLQTEPPAEPRRPADASLGSALCG